MTIAEYKAGLEPLVEQFNAFKNADEKIAEQFLEKICDYQRTNMAIIAKEYKEQAKGDPIKEIISGILDSIAEGGGSGCVCYEAESEEEAKAIDEILWEEIGEYLLDCETYFDKHWDKVWKVDCMAAGYYYPDWDGWWD